MNNPFQKAKPVNLALLALIVVAVAAVGITVVNGSLAAKKPGGGGGSPTPVTSSSSAQLYLTPPKSTAASGATVTVQIRSNSGSTNVNAVEADFSYPADKLDFVSVDDSASAYGVKAESSGSGGVVKVARGSTSALTGDQTVASVTFNVKPTAKGNVSLSFLPSSALVSSSTYKSIISSTAGATVQLGK